VDKGKIISVIFGWFSGGAPFAIGIYLGQEAFLPTDLAETIFLTFHTAVCLFQPGFLVIFL